MGSECKAKSGVLQLDFGNPGTFGLMSDGTQEIWRVAGKDVTKSLLLLLHVRAGLHFFQVGSVTESGTRVEVGVKVQPVAGVQGGVEVQLVVGVQGGGGGGGGESVAGRRAVGLRLRG